MNKWGLAMVMMIATNTMTEIVMMTTTMMTMITLQEQDCTWVTFGVDCYWDRRPVGFGSTWYSPECLQYLNKNMQQATVQSFEQNIHQIIITFWLIDWLIEYKVLFGSKMIWWNRNLSNVDICSGLWVQTIGGYLVLGLVGGQKILDLF